MAVPQQSLFIFKFYLLNLKLLSKIVVEISALLVFKLLITHFIRNVVTLYTALFYNYLVTVNLFKKLKQQLNDFFYTQVTLLGWCFTAFP